MIKRAIRKVGKGIKRRMDKKVEVCKEVLSAAENRLILGLIIVGAGVGIGGSLIASAYIHVPTN